MSYHNIISNTPTNTNGSGSSTTPNTPTPPTSNTPTGGNINPTSAQNAIDNDIPDLLIDYSELAKKHKLHSVLFRDAVTESMMVSLTTHKHPNIMLIGDAGTGKTAIVKDLALRLFNHEDLVTKMLGDKTKIYELPINNLVAGSSLVGLMEKKTNEVIDFISDLSKHAILYIDEIHQLSTKENLKGIAEILKPRLEDGSMHVIGSTTTQELKHLQDNPALLRRFSMQMVPELNDEQTEEIVKHNLPAMQKNRNPVVVTDDDIKMAVQVGNEFALTSHRPDSALTVIDKAMSLAILDSYKAEKQGLSLPPVVTNKLLRRVGNQLINNENNVVTTDKVMELQTQLDENIVGQQVAKDDVLQAIKTICRNLVPQLQPHSFLFAGYTGTGKTELAKQLAITLFGDESRMININMTEFADASSLTSLIGSSRGYVGSESDQPLPLDKLKTNPTQIVLLDEFEKATESVKRIFMKALDEGTLQYADGSTVNFSKAIVIATTNSGVEKLSVPKVGFGQTQKIQGDDLVKALAKDFPPELVNRFEYTVPFDKISKTEYAKVVVIKYNKFITEIENHHPELQIEPKIATIDMPFITTIVENSYNTEENARPAKRAVEHFVENEFENNPGQPALNFNK